MVVDKRDAAARKGIFTVDASKGFIKEDIAGHLFGGIPIDDIDALQEFWDVCPAVRKSYAIRVKK